MIFYLVTLYLWVIFWKFPEIEGLSYMDDDNTSLSYRNHIRSKIHKFSHHESPHPGDSRFRTGSGNVSTNPIVSDYEVLETLEGHHRFFSKQQDARTITKVSLPHSSEDS